VTAIRNIGPIPQLGFGTWNHSGEDAYNVTRWALETGFRHIDTAEGYNNEEFVGRAIAESGIARDQIFITTKVAPESYAPGKIMGHVKTSLEKLRIEKVDLLLLHWPSIKDQYDVNDYLKQFGEVFDAGLTKHIGVSNFTKKYLDAAIRILGHRPITTNQCEIHVLNQNHIIVDYCKSKSIPMTAYSPLARGALTDNQTLMAIGKKHNCSANQVALAFLMAEGYVVIPSSSNKARIKENFDAKDVVLTADDIATIRNLDEGRRLVNGAWCPVWDT
jgi:2,5-diketo-D-gluconate reductase B